MNMFAGAGGKFDGEFVAQIIMESLQRFDQQIVDGEPDRSAPVGIASEQAGLRFGGFVSDAICLSVNLKLVRMVLVKFRDRADAVRGKKLGLIQQFFEYAAEAHRTHQAQQVTLLDAMAHERREVLT